MRYDYAPLTLSQRLRRALRLPGAVPNPAPTLPPGWQPQCTTVLHPAARYLSAPTLSAAAMRALQRSGR